MPSPPLNNNTHCPLPRKVRCLSHRGKPELARAIMTAVYSEKECSLQSNNESLSSEYEKGSAQEVNIDPVSNSKACNARNTDGEMELCPRGPTLKAQDHAEVVAANAAVPPMKIKAEQVEEDECVVVHMDEAEEGDLADMFTSTGDSSERDGSTEGKQLFFVVDNTDLSVSH